MSQGWGSVWTATAACTWPNGLVAQVYAVPPHLLLSPALSSAASGPTRVGAGSGVWDPKENGAALVVLITALILHARWAGLIRERGILVAAVGGNIVLAWS